MKLIFSVTENIKMIKNIFISFLIISVSTVCLANEPIIRDDIPAQDVKIKNSIGELYGTWKIVGYKWGGISSSEEKDPKRHIGKTTLVFRADYAQLLGVSAIYCKAPKYRFHIEKNAADYLLDSYRASPDEIGIKTTELNVIDISCEGENNLPDTGPSADIFIIDKNKIIYKKDGPYYFLEKVKN